MTDEEMIKAANLDPDAGPMSERMLARANARHRLEKSRARRHAAALALVQAATDPLPKPESKGSARTIMKGPSPVTPKQ